MQGVHGTHDTHGMRDMKGMQGIHSIRWFDYSTRILCISIENTKSRKIILCLALEKGIRYVYN